MQGIVVQQLEEDILDFLWHLRKLYESRYGVCRGVLVGVVINEFSRRTQSNRQIYSILDSLEASGRIVSSVQPYGEQSTKAYNVLTPVEFAKNKMATLS